MKLLLIGQGQHSPLQYNLMGLSKIQKKINNKENSSKKFNLTDALNT